jgi:multidrug efflux pump subunit AcrB
MMIDFARDTGRNEGKMPREAVYPACPLRFRSILMTNRVPVLGALLLGTGTNIGSELRHPLDLSMVGCLLVSLALTLFALPTMYLRFERLQQRHCAMDDAVHDGEQGSAGHGNPAK